MGPFTKHHRTSSLSPNLDLDQPQLDTSMSKSSETCKTRTPTLIMELSRGLPRVGIMLAVDLDHETSTSSKTRTPYSTLVMEFSPEFRNSNGWHYSNRRATTSMSNYQLCLWWFQDWKSGLSTEHLTVDSWSHNTFELIQLPVVKLPTKNAETIARKIQPCQRTPRTNITVLTSFQNSFPSFKDEITDVSLPWRESRYSITYMQPQINALIASHKLLWTWHNHNRNHTQSPTCTLSMTAKRKWTVEATLRWR